MKEKDNRANRVAILGGTGFLGTNLRNTLEAAGFEVAVFGRTNGCDLLDLPLARSKLDAFRPRHIVNCAALVGSINFVTDFAADVFDVNMRIVLNVYRIAREMRDVVVVNPIANCAYPGVMDEYEEERLFDGPMDASVMSYGSTRRAMVIASKCYHNQYRIRSVNLVVPNLYGPFDSVNPNKTHALNALIIKFVAAVKFGLPRVEVWGTGKPIREWLYVKDAAEVVRRAIESGEESLEPVNLAQKHGQSVAELVELLRGMSGFKGAIEYDSKYQDGAPKRIMNDTRFRERFPDFRFTPQEAGVRETMDYYRKVLQRSDVAT